ncbi:MAG: endonuclease/exonuclease/phosphatase family protein [Pseudomonadota bacterium]
MVRRVVTIALFGFAALSVLRLTNRTSVGAGVWVLDLIAQFSIHIMVGAIALAFALVLQKRWRALAAILFVSIIGYWDVIGYSRVAALSSAADQGSFTVATANIWMSREALSSVLLLAEQADVDVLALNEAPQTSCKEILNKAPTFAFCRLVAEYPDGAPLSRTIALVSKTEPARWQVHYPTGAYHRAIIEAQFRLGGDDLLLVATHPMPPVTPSFLRARDITIETVKAIVGNETSFIVMGDFNTTPWAGAFGDLPGKRAGDPRGESTWLSGAPIFGLPIDHIMLGSDLSLHDYRVGPNIGSDHRPLFATLSIAENP